MSDEYNMEVVVEQDNVEVMREHTDTDNHGKFTGQCKWFNNSYGYGFLTICHGPPDGPQKGVDIFVHHTGIRPLNSMYKTLKKGEYVMFDIGVGDKGQQAVNVRGIYGGPLLCDHVQVKKTNSPSVPGYENENNVLPPHGENPWNTVSYTRKQRVPPSFLGTKRRRFVDQTESGQHPETV